MFQTETDLIFLDYLSARQADSEHIRLWEVAGTAHADAYQGMFELTDLGDGSAEVGLLDPAQATVGPLECAEPINAHGQYAVVNAALARLEKWVRTGAPPPEYPRIQTTGTGADATIVRDENGIARGGIRTPIVDVPLAANDGVVSDGPTRFHQLFGHTKPFDAATLARLYPNGQDEYVAAFDAAVDQAVRSEIWLAPEAQNFKAAARRIAFP
jgi:hypothetical protein